MVAFALSAGLAASRAAELSPAEKIYAALAKLPPDQRARAIEEGARKEGTLLLLHTFRGQEMRDHVALFQKRYPWLHIELSSSGSADAAGRLAAEAAAGRQLTDVVNLGVPDLTFLLRDDVLARYPTPATKAILPRYRQFLDPQSRWTPWHWSEHGISYNTNLVPPDKAPKSWQDLCNPYFKGSVSYDPGETLFLVGLYTMFGDAGTQRLLKCIGENKPIIQRGHDDRLNLMLAGDHMVQGDNYLFNGENLKRHNPATPYAIVYSAPIIAWAGVMVINKDTAHPYASALWVDWTLSKESQDYVAKILRGPLTEPHPFIPETAKLAIEGPVSTDVVAKLHAYWAKYVAKSQ